MCPDACSMTCQPLLTLAGRITRKQNAPIITTPSLAQVQGPLSAGAMDEFDAFFTSVTDQLRTQLRAFNHDSWLDSVRAFVHAVDWRVRAHVSWQSAAPR